MLSYAKAQAKALIIHFAKCVTTCLLNCDGVQTQIREPPIMGLNPSRCCVVIDP